jgi:hypothetical protein
MYGLSGHFTNEERDIQRKLRVLQHAEKIGNQTSAEIVEKVPLVCSTPASFIFLCLVS